MTEEPRVPTSTIACPQIAMGYGKVDVGVIHHEGRSGLLLRPRDHVIPVGDTGEINGDYWPKADDFVIWIDAPEGADVILSELAPLASSLDERERLREASIALEPFAKAGDAVILEHRKDERGDHWLFTGKTPLNIGDLRNARDVYNSIRSGDAG